MIYNNNQKGFTLIEILVSTALVITAATIVVSIITSTFRNSNNATSQERVRQAGTGTLNQVTDMLKFADDFQGINVNSDPDRHTCVTPDNSDNSPVDSIQFVYKSQSHTLSCFASDNSVALSLDGSSLYDPNSVVVSQCDISCTQTSVADPPVVSINLILSTPHTNSTNQENSASIQNLSQTVRMTNF